MPSPMVRPGNGTPCSMAELSCWKVARPLGCTDWPTVMKDDSGTMVPIGGAHPVLQDLVGGRALGARHLRDHLDSCGPAR